MKRLGYETLRDESRATNSGNADSRLLALGRTRLYRAVVPP
jgi:hypothetical protein